MRLLSTHKLFQPRLVWVCAWCPSNSYPALSFGEAYTHGICSNHQNKLLSNQAKFKLA